MGGADEPLFVSFCITSLRRNDQIMKTLPRNLDDNWNDRQRCEFVVVDFNPSVDNDRSLYLFVLKNFQKELQCGYLRYFCSTGLPSWHASIAKNTAHVLARGDILVNVDGDNFVGSNGAEHVRKQFQDERVQVVHQKPSGRAGDGTYGRIAIRSDLFRAIGGYNEQFLPMATQDVDLMLRASCYARVPIEVSRDRRYAHAIRNDKRRSVCMCSDDDVRQLTWSQMKNANVQLKRKQHERYGCLANVDADHIGVDPKTIQQYLDGHLVAYRGKPFVGPTSQQWREHMANRPNVAEQLRRARIPTHGLVHYSRLGQLTYERSTTPEQRVQRLQRLKQRAQQRRATKVAN